MKPTRIQDSLTRDFWRGQGLVCKVPDVGRVAYRLDVGSSGLCFAGFKFCVVDAVAFVDRCYKPCVSKLYCVSGETEGECRSMEVQRHYPCRLLF
jgi:hypothetical protein